MKLSSPDVACEAHSPMQRRLQILLRIPLLLVAAVLCCGCGGGSGKGSSGSTTGTTITDQQRIDALNDIGSHLAKLLRPQPGMGNQAAIDYLKTRPELMNVGGGQDLSVHAQFKDGRALVIMNNRGLTAGSSAAASLPARASTREPLLVPTSGQYRVLNALGPGFTYTTPAVKRISLALSAAHYTPASIPVGTDPAGVQALKNVSGDGVFIISTHGGLGLTPTLALFPCLRTSTVVNLGDEIALRQSKDMDGDPPPVCYSFAYNGPGQFDYTLNYAITPAFAQKYWSFAQNGFVYLGACSSNLLGFPQACLAKGASAVASWTNPTLDSDDALAMITTITRMLGDPSGSPLPGLPENQRPHNITDVSDYLKVTTNPTTNLPLNQSNTTDDSTDQVYKAVLVFDFAHGNVTGQLNSFGILNPSIAQAKYQTNTIFLYGDFGADDQTQTLPRKVMIGSKDVTAQTTWGPIMLVINNVPLTGAGSSGDIYVMVGDHKSNVIRLTEWRGDFTVETKSGATDGSGLNTKTVFHAHFRAILSLLNNTLYGTPYIAGVPSGGATGYGLQTELDSNCDFTASGTQTVDGQFIQYSTNGNGNVSFTSPINTTNIGLSATIPDLTVSPLQMEIGLTMRDDTGIVQKRTDLQSQRTTTSNTLMRVVVDPQLGHAAKLDDNFNILGGGYTDGTTTVSWSTISAISPPDPNASRAAALYR